MKLNECDVEKKLTIHAISATAITFDGDCSALALARLLDVT